MSLPPLPEALALFTPTEKLNVRLNWIVQEYGEACRKAALEEAHAWMMQRHQVQKHRDNYMLVEADRFKKDLLVLP